MLILENSLLKIKKRKSIDKNDLKSMLKTLKKCTVLHLQQERKLSSPQLRKLLSSVDWELLMLTLIPVKLVLWIIIELNPEILRSKWKQLLPNKEVIWQTRMILTCIIVQILYKWNRKLLPSLYFHQIYLASKMMKLTCLPIQTLKLLKYLLL